MIKLFPLISITNKRKNYSITESIISKSNTFILNLSIETTIERMSRKTTIFIKFHKIYKSSLQKKKKKKKPSFTKRQREINSSIGNAK